MATQIRYGEFTMTGQQLGIQPKIFYPHMNLEQRVPRTHLLRKTRDQIDLNFIYAEVRDIYRGNGIPLSKTVSSAIRNNGGKV
jgi:hypothetical protein